MLLNHEPPVTPSESDVVAPIHTEEAPMIVPAPAAGLIVRTLVATAVPQLFVTV
jgi:hypothetical protein